MPARTPTHHGMPFLITSVAATAPTRSDSFKLNNKVIYTFGRKDGRFTVKLGKLVDKGVQKELAEELQEFLRGWLTKRMKDR